LFFLVLDNEELDLDEFTEDIMHLNTGESSTQEFTTILTSA